jgi:hypothetical protein
MSAMPQVGGEGLVDENTDVRVGKAERRLQEQDQAK